MKDKPLMNSLYLRVKISTTKINVGFETHWNEKN